MAVRTIARLQPAPKTLNVTQLGAHLRAAGIDATVKRVTGEAVYITADATVAAMDAALATFVNEETWQAPVSGDDLGGHAAHLRTFYRASLAERAALTQVQRDHVLEDVIRALAVLVDERLG